MDSFVLETDFSYVYFRNYNNWQPLFGFVFFWPLSSDQRETSTLWRGRLLWNQLLTSNLWGTDLCKGIFKQPVKVSHGNSLPVRILVKYRMFWIFIPHIKEYHHALGILDNWVSLILFTLYFKILKAQSGCKTITSFKYKSHVLPKVLSICFQSIKLYIFPCVCINRFYIYYHHFKDNIQ